MKILSSFFLLLLTGLLPAADGLYLQKVMHSGEASPGVRESAQTLADWLGKITGQPFEVVEGEAGTTEDVIQLWTVREAKAAGIVPEALLKELKAGNTEAFALESTPDKPGLRIIGASELGVRHGVYWYLSKLGFRSLFPGEHWRIVPKKDNIRVTASEVEEPAYRQREFFGTGGFHTRLPLDPEAKIARMWKDWKDANLFGAPIGLGGHYGEAFIRKHKEVLEAHPEYRAMVNGKRAPMSDQFQLNYGNKELRELYIQDRVDDLRLKIENDPTGDRIFSMTVDPADGGGHCESPEAAALGSVSDQVFGLANDVARRINEEFPGHYVNLYAYNEHSDVTTFPLEKNVIVSVIPYGFNRAKTLMGDDLLLAWKDKATQIGLYDYWGLPDWSHGTPSVDYLKEIPRKLNFWHANKVRFFNAETTTGAGTAGIPLYLASRMLWDAHTNAQAVITEFYDLAFGPARPPMQRLLERWASGFSLQDNEIGLSFRDLKEALELAGDNKAIRARIGDYITYVQYLRLLREFNAAEDKEAKLQAADALIRFIWQIRDNAMVQTFRITQLMLNTWMKDDTLKSTWDYNNPEAPGWASVPAPPTKADLVALLDNGLKDYPVFFEPKSFSQDLVPLRSPVETDAESLETYRMIKAHTFLFQPDRDGEEEFSVRFGLRDKATQLAIVTVKESGTGKEILEKTYPLDGEWHSFKVPVKKGVTYRLTVQDRTAHLNLRAPASLPLVLSGGVVPVGWTTVKNWFHVPKGTRRFAVYIPRNAVPEKLKVAMGEDEVIEPVFNRGGFTVYEVPEGGDARVWTIEKFTTPLPAHLVNIPDNLAFSADTVLVPRETLEEK